MYVHTSCTALVAAVLLQLLLCQHSSAAVHTAPSIINTLHFHLQVKRHLIGRGYFTWSALYQGIPHYARARLNLHRATTVYRTAQAAIKDKQHQLAVMTERGLSGQPVDLQDVQVLLASATQAGQELDAAAALLEPCKAAARAANAKQAPNAQVGW